MHNGANRNVRRVMKYKIIKFNVSLDKDRFKTLERLAKTEFDGNRSMTVSQAVRHFAIYVANNNNARQ